VVAAAIGATLAAGSVPGLAPAGAQAADPLVDGRQRAAEATYSGVRAVLSFTEGGQFAELFRIEHEPGATRVESVARTGGSQAEGLTSDEGSWAARGGQWETLGPSPADVAVPPAVQDKYELLTKSGSELSRPVTILTLRAGGETRDVVVLDDGTGVVLRRESYLAGGRLWRLQAYLQFADRAPAMPTPPPLALRGATTIPDPHNLRGDFSAPPSLSNGYMLGAAYDAGGMVHLVYSDGLYTISVFQQPGRIGWDELPPGGLARLAGEGEYRRYCQATSQAVVWGGEHTTFVAIGDAPPDDLVGAMAAFPHVPAPPGVGTRVRGLLDAISFWN